jgi:hypothetical protein
VKLSPAPTRRGFLTQGAALGLCAVGGNWLRAAEAAWPDERTTGNFRCHADFSLAEYVGLLDELGELQTDLATELEIELPRAEIHLFLFERRATYSAYLQQYFPKVPARKALYIKGRGPGMVFAFRSDELEMDVRHEGTHALLHTALTRLPLWLDEGFAEYYEVPAGERVSKNPYLTAVKWNLRLGHVPDLATLERLKDLNEMGRNEYRDAWAWVHYLLHGGAEPRDALRGYLRQLAATEDPGELSAHLRRWVGDPSEGFARHFRTWKAAT